MTPESLAIAAFAIVFNSIAGARSKSDWFAALHMLIASGTAAITAWNLAYLAGAAR